MKIRDGFVSNSSSSSFIISLDNITGKQMRQIKNHVAKMVKSHYDNSEDAWQITIDDNNIKGYSSMDNFDMNAYLDEIGVDPAVVEWEEY